MLMIASTIAFYSFFAIPLILWLVNRLVFRNRIHWLLLWPMAMVCCYAVLLVGVQLLNAHLEAELYKHDLNGDGSFEGAEFTPKMEEAMDRLSGDTGRALAPFTGIPFSLIWVTLNYIPLGLFSLAICYFRSHRGDFDSMDADNADRDRIRLDPANPYRPLQIDDNDP